MSGNEQRRILVVDDEQPIRDLVRRTFAGDAFVVDEAASGEEALVLAADVTPDLVVLDWQMPGMTGAEVLTELAKRYPQLPVILLTAALDSRNGGIARIFGAAEFIQKPFHPGDLLATARRLLGT